MDRLILLLTFGVFLFFALVLAVFTLRLRRSGKTRELWRAYAVQFLTVGCILIPAYFGGIAFAVAIALLAAAASWELLGTVEPVASRVLKLVGGAASIAVVLLFHFSSFPRVLLFALIPAAAVALAALFDGSWSGAARRVVVALLGFIYVPLFLSHLLLVRRLAGGFLLVFFAYGVSEMSDSFAYVVGKLFGKRKVFPKLSPNKTYAGLVGGILGGLVFALLLDALAPSYRPAAALCAAAFVVVASIAGDLAASKIKRLCRVKDFGNLVPGSGGVLDVYDSLLLVSPLFFYLVELGGARS